MKTILLTILVSILSVIGFNQLKLGTYSGDIQSSAIANVPSFGQVLVGNNQGTYTLTATSSFGLPTMATLTGYLTLTNWYATTTDQLTEGSTNLYFTDIRARNALFSTALYGLSTTTTIGFLNGIIAMSSSTLAEVNFSSYSDYSAVSEPSAPLSGVRIWAETQFDKTRLTIKNGDGLVFTFMRDNMFVARNKTGSNMATGTVVYIDGQLGNSRPTINLADADADATMPAVGITAEAIDDNSDGYVMHVGKLSGLDTSGADAGAHVYVSQTPGQFTSTRPPMPAFTQPVGTILTSHGSNGSIFVNTPPIQRFGLLTSGSVMFGNSSGAPNQNNANFLWDDSATILYTNASVSRASSTVQNLNSTQICISGDCKTAWPSGSGFAYPFPDNATSTILNFSGGIFSTASSTFQSLYLGTTDGGLGVDSSGKVYKAATTTYGTGITYANGAVTCDTASGSVFGCLSTANWTTFNAKESALTFVAPLTRSVNSISLNLGATYYWLTGEQIFSNSIAIATGTNPTLDAIGEIAIDTTNGDFLFSTSTNTSYPGVVRSEVPLFRFKVASTSQAYASSSMQIPGDSRAFFVTSITCNVEGGTSVALNLSDGGRTLDTNTVTCSVGLPATTAITTNRTWAALTRIMLEWGTKTGAVDYVNITINGTWTRT